MHHVYSQTFYITTVAGYDVVSREIADKIGGGVGGGGWGGWFWRGSKQGVFW